MKENSLDKIIVNVSKIECGYSATCDLLPICEIEFLGEFDKFLIHVVKLIGSYIENAKKDNPEFNKKYKLVFNIEEEDEKLLKKEIDSFISFLEEQLC